MLDIFLFVYSELDSWKTLAGELNAVAADQLVTKLADPAKSNPSNFSIWHPASFPIGERRKETVAVNEVYRPLMRIDVNSLSA